MKLPIVINRSKKLFSGTVTGFTFLIWIYVYKHPDPTTWWDKMYKIIINHETIHYKQEVETLFILFYLIYGLEYLIKLIILKDKNSAYRAISFEQEAYEYENDFDYLSKRKPFAWVKYVFSLN